MSAHLSAGTIFAGRYRIIKSLAAGGMGEVYEAVHLETRRRKALKIMHGHLIEDGDMRDRFMREARISAEIESEFIVDVSDAGIDEASRMPFLVMELLHGEDLSRRLRRVGRFAPAEIIAYFNQIAIALDKTHAAEVVHRDLKPDNLFLTQREDGSPRIKILDFGVAKAIANRTARAASTQILGTPLYMAPEQFNPEVKLTGTVDIFAMGMVIYELLAGQKYWFKETSTHPDLMALLLATSRGPQESAVLRAANAGVILPKAFDAWFYQMTAADPSKRFQKASDAARALEQVFAPIEKASTPSDLPDTSKRLSIYRIPTENAEQSPLEAHNALAAQTHTNSAIPSLLSESKTSFNGSTSLPPPRTLQVSHSRPASRWLLAIVSTLTSAAVVVWMVLTPQRSGSLNREQEHKEPHDVPTPLKALPEEIPDAGSPPPDAASVPEISPSGAPSAEPQPKPSPGSRQRSAKTNHAEARDESTPVLSQSIQDTPPQEKISPPASAPSVETAPAASTITPQKPYTME